MDIIALVVLLFCLFILTFIVIYFIYDYLNYKEQISIAFSTTSGEISGETVNRLSNLKYVVEQVNDINNDIYNTITTDVNKLESEVNSLNTTQNNIISGVNSVMNFENTNTDITNVAKSGNTPNVDLIKQVSLTMGMTAKNLQPMGNGPSGNNSANTVQFCAPQNSDGTTKCIKLPDSSGNTYLTTLTPSGSIILDAPTNFTNTLYFNNGISSNGQLSTDANGNLYLNPSNNIGISNSTSFSNPTALLHVQGLANGNDIFTVSKQTITKSNTTNSKALNVDNNGNINIYGAINIFSADGSKLLGTLGDNGNGKLMIHSNNSTIPVDMDFVNVTKHLNAPNETNRYLTTHSIQTDLINNQPIFNNKK